MAAEFKTISRCLHPATLGVLSRLFNKGPRNLIQPSKNFSCCLNNFLPQSKCLNIFTSTYTRRHNFDLENLIQPFNCFNSCPETVTHQGSIDLKCPKKLIFSSNILHPKSSTTQYQYNSCYSLFRPLDPLRNAQNYNLLHGNRKTLHYLKGLPKTFFSRRKNDEKKPKRRIPKLILIQNPFTWIMIKIDFSVLRNIWDPEFKEKDFKFGTMQV